MVDPIAPIAPSVAVPPVQPVINTSAVNAINNSVGLFEQEVILQNEEQLLGLDRNTANQTSIINTPPLDNITLANLGPQALVALSDANNSAINKTGSGNLTSVQLEEIAVLQHDAELLNTPGIPNTFNSNESLLNSASTINLSPQAIDILNGVQSVTAGSAFTSAQLQQLAGILTPFVNLPLTQGVLTQIQNALTAVGFNPEQLSLQTIFLSMNFQAELLPALPDAEQLALNETITEELQDT
jgi:hypothetical protein